MKIKKLKIVVTFESEKLARMLEIRKVYLGMPESKFLGFRHFLQQLSKLVQSLNFNNFWNIKIWTLYDVVLKFAHPEFWLPKKLEFLNLSFNLRTLRMSQNIEKLAINYHFQISKNESINFTNWRGRLNVEHEKQETENWC